MKQLSAALAAMLLAAPAQATTLTSIFDSFFVLGDSLSDNGNTATMVGRLAAQPENAPNVNFRPPRFAQQPGVSSDGPTWTTGIVSEFQNAGKTAANLSFGAAWAADNGEGPPDLADQINGAADFDTTFSFYAGEPDAFTISGTVPKYPDFGGGLASRIGGSNDRALVTVFIGGNDFLGAVPQIGNDPTSTPEILNATVASTFGAVTSNSERLFSELGVRDFIFMNLPDFSVIPFFNDPTSPNTFAIGQGLSVAAQAYNDLLFGTDTAPGYIDSLRARGNGDRNRYLRPSL